MKREGVNGDVQRDMVDDRRALPLPTIVRGSTTTVLAPYRDTENITFSDCWKILNEARLGLMGVGVHWCWDFSTHLETLPMSQRQSVLNFAVDPVVPSITSFNHLTCGVIILGALKNIFNNVCEFTYVLGEREYGEAPRRNGPHSSLHQLLMKLGLLDPDAVFTVVHPDMKVSTHYSPNREIDQVSYDRFIGTHLAILDFVNVLDSVANMSAKFGADGKFKFQVDNYLAYNGSNGVDTLSHMFEHVLGEYTTLEGLSVFHRMGRLTLPGDCHARGSIAFIMHLSTFLNLRYEMTLEMAEFNLEKTALPLMDWVVQATENWCHKGQYFLEKKDNYYMLVPLPMDHATMRNYKTVWNAPGGKYCCVTILPVNPIQHGVYKNLGESTPYFNNRRYNQLFVTPCLNNPSARIHLGITRNETLVNSLAIQLETGLTLLGNRFEGRGPVRANVQEELNKSYEDRFRKELTTFTTNITVMVEDQLSQAVVRMSRQNNILLGGIQSANDKVISVINKKVGEIEFGLTGRVESLEKIQLAAKEIREQQNHLDSRIGMLKTDIMKQHDYLDNRMDILMDGNENVQKTVTGISSDITTTTGDIMESLSNLSQDCSESDEVLNNKLDIIVGRGFTYETVEQGVKSLANKAVAEAEVEVEPATASVDESKELGADEVEPTLFNEGEDNTSMIMGSPDTAMEDGTVVQTVQYIPLTDDISNDVNGFQEDFNCLEVVPDDPLATAVNAIHASDSSVQAATSTSYTAPSTSYATKAATIPTVTPTGLIKRTRTVESEPSKRKAKKGKKE